MERFGISEADATKAPVRLTVEATSILMHGSDFFWWMKPDPDAFRLTGFPENLLRSVNLFRAGTTHLRGATRLPNRYTGDQIRRR